MWAPSSPLSKQYDLSSHFLCSSTAILFLLYNIPLTYSPTFFQYPLSRIQASSITMVAQTAALTLALFFGLTSAAPVVSSLHELVYPRPEPPHRRRLPTPTVETGGRAGAAPHPPVSGTFGATLEGGAYAAPPHPSQPAQAPRGPSKPPIVDVTRERHSGGKLDRRTEGDGGNNHPEHRGTHPRLPSDDTASHSGPNAHHWKHPEDLKPIHGYGTRYVGPYGTTHKGAGDRVDGRNPGQYKRYVGTTTQPGDTRSDGTHPGGTNPWGAPHDAAHRGHDDKDGSKDKHHHRRPEGKAHDESKVRTHKKKFGGRGGLDNLD